MSKYTNLIVGCFSILLIELLEINNSLTHSLSSFYLLGNKQDHTRWDL